VKAVLLKAETKKHPVAVAAYDAGGALKIFVRQDHLVGVASLISRKVGEFSYLFPMASQEFQGYLEPTTGRYYTFQNAMQGLVAAAGGAPAILNRDLYASFGVSGGFLDPLLDQQLALEAAKDFVDSIKSLE
jgi:uncharacterized protein GlcG (DUF336 family)